MFNDIVIGPITIHMYGVMIAAGFLAALLMTLRRGKKRGYDEDLIWGIFFCAIIGGMLGTRILYYIVEIPEIMKDPSILWDFKNGYVVYGGIIGGILAVAKFAPAAITAVVSLFPIKKHINSTIATVHIVFVNCSIV